MTDASTPIDERILDPDVQLMLRVKQDDAIAFEMLIDRHQGKLIRFMQGWGANLQQSEDLAQDVFLRVFRSRTGYEPTAKFTTWLYRIAHNVASNHVRDKSVKKELQLVGEVDGVSTGNVLERIALAPSGFHPAKSIDKSERSQMVLQALQALGERQRTAIMLSKFEGMSYQEISDIMGLSVQAIKSLLSRARVNLKQLLDPYIQSGSVPDVRNLSEQASGASGQASGASGQVSRPGVANSDPDISPREGE